MRKALVLTDGKAGHENQSRALARMLGCEAEIVEVHFKSKFRKTLSYLFDRLGIRTPSFFSFQFSVFNSSSRYSVVIGTGSGTFYAAKAVAKKLGVKCAVVLYPRGYDIASFDCVLAPAFDNPKKAANVIEIPANLVAADKDFYAKGVTAFKERASAVPEVAVIVGGPNKCSTMTADWMKARLDEIFTSRCTKGVTTSRRTPPEVEAVIDSYPWDYKLIYSRDHFNPIPAFVAEAKALYVTAESTGMLSEACTSGTAEVHALDNLVPGRHKFRRFVENLAAGGYLDGNRKIDLADEIARARRLLDLN